MHHTTIRIHHITHHTHHIRRTYHTYLFLTVGGCSDDEGSRVTHTQNDEDNCKDRRGNGGDDCSIDGGGVRDVSSNYGPESSDFLGESDRRGEKGDCGSGDSDRKGDYSGSEQKSDCAWSDRMGDCGEQIVECSEYRPACVNEASISNDRERKIDMSEEQVNDKEKEMLREEGGGYERRETEERQKDHNNEQEEGEELEETTNDYKTQELGQKESKGEEREEEEGEETTGERERQRDATKRVRTLAKVGCVVA